MLCLLFAFVLPTEQARLPSIKNNKAFDGDSGEVYHVGGVEVWSLDNPNTYNGLAWATMLEWTTSDRMMWTWKVTDFWRTPELQTGMSQNTFTLNLNDNTLVGTGSSNTTGRVWMEDNDFRFFFVETFPDSKTPATGNAVWTKDFSESFDSAFD